MKKERENHSFVAIPQTAKVMAAADDECLVKVEKLLNWCNKIF